MSDMLPPGMSLAAFRGFRAEPSLYLPAIHEIARRHGLAREPVEPFANGTNLVLALGATLVLKLFPPPLAHQFRSERAALEALQGRLRVAIPEIVAEGRSEDWSYLVMTRLAGTSGKEAWPRLAEAEKQLLLDELGALIREVQSVPPEPLAHLEPRWSEFLRRQIEGCKARHRRLGLAPHLLCGLDALLEEARRIIPRVPPLVILTGEYVPENLLLRQDGDRWRLGGVIDFGDVMTGFGEYDLLGPSCFMTAGVAGRVSALLRGYGYAPADIDASLTRRLLALMFLHRFSDPRRHVAIPGWEAMAKDIAGLEGLLWPLG